MTLPPNLKLHLKFAFSGALGAMLALVLGVGLLGARGHDGRGDREGRGFARQVLARLDAIDQEVGALGGQVAALAPQIAQLQSAVANLTPQVTQIQADVANLAPQVGQIQSDVAVLSSSGGAGGGAAAPPQVFSLQLCLKGGLAGEAGFSGEQALKIEGQARVGAEGFGNGIMAWLRGIPGAKIGGGVKGDVGGELQGCFDLRALAQRIKANAPPFPMTPGQQQNVLRMAATDQATLAGKLLDFASLTSLDPAALQPALDVVPQLSADVDPLKMADPVNNLTELAQVVPLSFQARGRLQDMKATFDAFEQQRNLCSLNLPPSLANVVDPICNAAASEPLKPALQATASRVTNIQSRVTSVQSAVSGIRSVVNRICYYLPGC